MRILVAVAAALKRWFSRATEPHILFPAIAVLVLAMIWGTTLNLIGVERAAAERAAAASSGELAETYEAQVVRALREIDQTLKFVKYAYEFRGKQVVLRELKARALLPPDLFFVVSIADSRGEVVASTSPAAVSNVAGQDYFQSQRQSDAFSIGLPQKSPGTGEWKLHFSHSLNAADGSFSGIAMISVDPAYFVSGYESSKLGEHGVLGILGTDGIFRARRSGETASAGDKVAYATVVFASGEAAREAVLSTNPWDGVSRYTVARQLYGFPLAVIAGLSEDEQLAAARRDMRTYLWRASAGSLLLLLVVALLGGMSRQLELTRVRAVEAQIAHAARVEYLAYHDGLTDLPNRSLFSRLLSQSINHAHRYKRQLAVLFLDLDRFKQVNDSLGHEAGDLLLQEVATRLKACLRHSDTVARLGGDEFVALLPELEQEKYVVTVAQKILTTLGQPFVLLGKEFRVTASIGISIYPDDGQDEQTLTKNADIAMYHAKQEGKNNFQFYSAKLNANTLERVTLETGLRQALEKDQFVLHYQPKVELDSLRIVGVEALIRWNSPDLGLVPPGKFIPLMEETGMILDVGAWALDKAIEDHLRWQKLGVAAPRIAVNVSPVQLRRNEFFSTVENALERGTKPTGLDLEITESLIMEDIEGNIRKLKEVRALGVSIAIDDFGTGYSSLAYLAKLPVQTLKIDRSFVITMLRDSDTMVLVQTIISLAHSLRLKVIAEGVDEEEQADWLRMMHCDEMQGYLFSKPIPFDEMTALLKLDPGV